MNWELLINENTIGCLLPDAYAHYRSTLRGALILFLQGLSVHRQEAITMEQATLPSHASAFERFALLARSCPVLQKLCQTLARDRNLSAELRGFLQGLESLPASIPFEAIKTSLTRELGPLHRLGVTLVHPALAEASVAVVVPFRSVGRESPPNGVFKVLKPGIEQRLEEELNILDRVGSFLDQRCDDLKIPQIGYRESFKLVRDKLRDEVRLDKEQENISLARQFYRGDHRVWVPEVFSELCTRRVTAMERVTGQKVTEYRSDFPSDSRRMARLVIETLIARPIFSREPRAPFHGDPHAGNIFYTQDNGLAVLDWSLTGVLSEQDRISLMQIVLGAVTFSVERVMRILCALSNRPIRLHALKSIVSKWIRLTLNGHMPGLTWLTGLLDEAVGKAGLRLGPDLMLFRKTLYMVEGVVADFGAAGLIDKTLLGEFILHFSAEWPTRFLTLPDSHSFATRISNMELAELMLSLAWKIPATSMARLLPTCAVQPIPQK